MVRSVDRLCEDVVRRECDDAWDSVRGRCVGRTTDPMPAVEGRRANLGLEDPADVDRGMLARDDARLLSGGSPERSILP